mmetsp:Transcript_25324/g.44212  ORF Transcript_25324/g.44212 Transcript_25324/m.44212 type:complete len:81 (+) Transcript_25324:45-287(+)
MGKWFGPDIAALSVPITFAACGFSFMIFRAFAFDPEWTSGMQFYEKPESEDMGKNYRMQYQQFFRSGRMSVFPNKIEVAE